MSDGSVSMEEEIQRFVENPRKVLGQVEKFRQEIKFNLEKLLEDAEHGVENSLLNHSLRPEIYPVFTPELTQVGEDRLLIALSIALFEYSNPSSNPLHRELERTSEASTGRTAEGLLNGFRNDQFEWSAKYEKEDNSLLINELPEEVLPPSKDVPPILAFLWNSLNTNVNAGTNRNYGLTVADVEARTVHEMTHAINTNAANPLKNSRTAAVDEASAMASTYAVIGKMPTPDYSDRGLDQRKLEEAQKILGKFVERKGHNKQTVSLLRNISIQSIRILENDNSHDVKQVLQKVINDLS